jgi:hypothetical protein
MAVIKQSTEKPFVGEMRKINGIVKEWKGNQWVAHTQVKKQPYARKEQTLQKAS